MLYAKRPQHRAVLRSMVRIVCYSRWRPPHRAVLLQVSAHQHRGCLRICYDIRFPELAMLYAKRGVQVLVYPGERIWGFFVCAVCCVLCAT